MKKKIREKLVTNSNKNFLFNLSTLRISGYKPVSRADLIMLILLEFLLRSFRFLESANLINPTLFKMSNILDLQKVPNTIWSKIWKKRSNKYFKESIEFILNESMW